MLRRFLPLALLSLAVCGDAGGAHRLAFYALLLAIPATAAAGLDRFAAALDGASEPRQAVVLALALALVVLSEAARSPHLAENVAPALAVSTLAAAAALLGLQAARALLGGRQQKLPGPAHESASG